MSEDDLVALGRLLEQAYGEAEIALIDYGAAAETEIGYKTEYERCYAYSVADGLITGKNETERAASAAHVLELQQYNLADAQADARKAKLRLDVARLHLEKAKNMLRLAELTASSSLTTISASAFWSQDRRINPQAYELDDRRDPELAGDA